MSRWAKNIYFPKNTPPTYYLMMGAAGSPASFSTWPSVCRPFVVAELSMLMYLCNNNTSALTYLNDPFRSLSFLKSGHSGIATTNEQDKGTQVHHQTCPTVHYAFKTLKSKPTT